MAITSTEVAEILGFTTASGKQAQVEALLPYITVQINDYCGGTFSRQVKEESITFTSTTKKQVTNYPIVKGSVYITSTDRGTRYNGDTQFGSVVSPTYYIPSTYVRDYDVDYSTGGLWISTTDSQIGTTESVLVTYAFVDITDGAKVAAARMIDQGISNQSGIASESVGGLSRSYTEGMDPIIRTMLAPYKRPRVI